MKLLLFELRAERSAPITPCLSLSRWIPRFIVESAVLGLIIVLAVSLAACGGTTASPSNSGPVTLTFWTWVPNIQSEVNLFEQSHPNIKIKVVNAGQGAPAYTKLRTALKAGSGGPDIVQIEFQYLPTFELTGDLVDLSKYSANTIQNDYMPWTWSQVTQGSKVYAIPQDSGPMGLLYRKDIFDQYDPAALQVANYWGNLINQKVVQTAPDFTTDWYTGLAKGTYATWVTAAWGPVFLAGVAAQSAGKWRAAPLPQWTAGGQATANWGGSTDAVTTQSQHPKEAAEFAMWLNHDQNSATMFAQKQFLFPTLKGVLNDPSFINTASSFYGGQQVNQVFASASSKVDTNFQWSPFQDYVYTQMGDQLGVAINGKSTFEQAMNKLQSSVVTYAKSQGFTVG